MTAPLWLTNLAAWSVQVAVLVAVGGLLPFLFRLRDPKARLALCHIVLIGCLLLPAAQRWQRPPAATAANVSVSSTSVHGKPGPNRVLPPLEDVVAGALTAGIFARAVWLVLGFWRLRRRRRNARVLDSVPSWLEQEQARLGVQPKLCTSDEILGPVTFGVRRPTVLLPARFFELEPAAQRAIACHELLHVKRRDWLFTVAEEAIRTVVWFHPAIWWLLAQIQLAREQVVDHEVVRLTGDRDQYLQALLAIAVHRQAELAPASLFLRKGHLTRRAASLLQEVSMSKRRLIVSLSAILVALILTGRFAAWSFPLQAPARAEGYVSIDSDRQVSVDTGGAKLLHRTPIEYPREAREKRIEGAVVLELTLDRKGQVADARVISGPEELRRAALQSVLQWHYSMDPPLPAKLTLTINFQLTGRSPLNAPPPPPPPADMGVLRRVDTGSISESMREAILNRLPVREGDLLTPATQLQIQQALAGIDEHLSVGYRQGPEGAVMVVFIRGQGPAATTAQPGRIRVGGKIQEKNLIESPPPGYPPLAKQARVQGTVRLNVTINREGRVQNIEVESGHPLLVPSAMEAVKRWVYRPTYLNGQPTEVVTQVEIDFSLP